MRRPSLPGLVALNSNAPPAPVYGATGLGASSDRWSGRTVELESRPTERRCTPGLRSGSSRSGTAIPSSVVSMPFGRPCRAPAAGTWSIGRGACLGRGPERTRLLEVSSLEYIETLMLAPLLHQTEKPYVPPEGGKLGE